MDLNFERKLSANSWIINARWLYVLGIFSIGSITKAFDNANVNFPFTTMVAFLLTFSFINISFHVVLLKIKKNPSQKQIDKLGISQIIFELFFYTLILHYAGGVESIAMIYFITPIVFSSLFFGSFGSFLTALTSIVIITSLILLEKYGVIQHINRYRTSSIEFERIELSLIKVMTFSVFYLIIGLLSAYNFKNLINREDLLEEKSRKLNKDFEKRNNELKQLDDTAKLLIRRDMMLMQTNNELDEKIDQLKSAEEIQKRAFLQLKEERIKVDEEKKKINSIISNLIDPIIFIGNDNKISLFNPAAHDVFGLNAKHKRKKIDKKNNFSMNNFRIIIKPKYKVKSAKELKINDDNIEEIVLQEKDDFEITYKVITAKVIADDNEYFGTLKIFYNLTREKMIDRFKSEFISVAAHQLRTPLSAIKWAIKMVLDGDTGILNQEQKQVLNRGYQSNERIINLVNDMLNVSRIEEGRFGYSFEQSRIEDVIDYVTGNLEGKMKSKKIKLFVKKPDKTDPIYMDREKMSLVFQNLLENAVKYTPEYGTIYIYIEKEKDFLTIKIQDNGVGIPKNDQVKIFSKFFRAANVVRLQTEGSGLGLFIAKNVIEKHGGTIKCSSAENKGTEFVFTLPLKNKAKKKVL